jgi:hypothetical protein
MDQPNPFPGCGGCAGHACEQLRSAGSDSSALLAVAAHETVAQCPFACTEPDELAALLADLSLHDLIFLVESVIDELPPGEANRFRLSHYCQDYRDAAGRIAFVKAVVDEGLIAVLRSPPREGQ